MTTITQITGYEPRLSRHHSKQGRWQLSLRGLATRLGSLPPDAISIEAARKVARKYY